MQVQQITSHVVGPGRTTVISLDMGLYQPAKKLQMARNDESSDSPPWGATHTHGTATNAWFLHRKKQHGSLLVRVRSVWPNDGKADPRREAHEERRESSHGYTPSPLYDIPESFSVSARSTVGEENQGLRKAAA